jgi:hypothetical protein
MLDTDSEEKQLNMITTINVVALVYAVSRYRNASIRLMLRITGLRGMFAF